MAKHTSKPANADGAAAPAQGSASPSTKTKASALSSSEALIKDNTATAAATERAGLASSSQPPPPSFAARFYTGVVSSIDKIALICSIAILLGVGLELFFPTAQLTRLYLNPPTPHGPCTGPLARDNQLGSICGFHNPVDLEAIHLKNNKTLVLAVRHEHMYYDRTAPAAGENPQYGLQGHVDGTSKLLWPTRLHKKQLSLYQYGVENCLQPPSSDDFRPASLGIQRLPKASFSKRRNSAAPEDEFAKYLEDTAPLVSTVVVLNQSPSRYTLELFELVGAWDSSSTATATIVQDEPQSQHYEAFMSEFLEGAGLLWMGCVPVPRQYYAYGDVDLLDAQTAIRNNKENAGLVLSGDPSGFPNTASTVWSYVFSTLLGMTQARLLFWSLGDAARDASANAPKPRWKEMYLSAPIPKSTGGILVSNGRVLFANQDQVCRVDLPHEIPAAPMEPIRSENLTCVTISASVPIQVQFITHFSGSAAFVVARANTLTSIFRSALCALGRSPCDIPSFLYLIHMPSMQVFPLLKLDPAALGYVTSVSYADNHLYFGSLYGDRVGVVRLGVGNQKLLRKVAKTN